MPVGPARRIVYLGTPEVAVAPLRALVGAGVDVALVITRVDKRRGRGSGLSPSPVKAAALELGLPVSHELSDALTVGADLGVVVAYGRIIPMSVLSLLPMVNVHFSLLPRWRGAAPVERALMTSDSETGICIMRVEEGLDTGVVYERRVVPIRPEHTLTSLRTELVELAIEPLLRVVTHGSGPGEPQLGEPTHAAKIAASELQIDWTNDARDIAALTRLETAWFMLEGRRIRAITARVADTAGADAAPGSVIGSDRHGVRIATGRGAILLERVQPEGRTPMSAADWANGMDLPASLA